MGGQGSLWRRRKWMEWRNTRWKFRKLNYTQHPNSPALTSTAPFFSTEKRREWTLMRNGVYAGPTFSQCWHGFFYSTLSEVAIGRMKKIFSRLLHWCGGLFSQLSSFWQGKRMGAKAKRGHDLQTSHTGHNACPLHLHPHIWHHFCVHLTDHQGNHLMGI